VGVGVIGGGGTGVGQGSAPAAHSVQDCKQRRQCLPGVLWGLGCRCSKRNYRRKEVPTHLLISSTANRRSSVFLGNATGSGPPSGMGSGTGSALLMRPASVLAGGGATEAARAAAGINAAARAEVQPVRSNVRRCVDDDAKLMAWVLLLLMMCLLPLLALVGGVSRSLAAPHCVERRGAARSVHRLRRCNVCWSALHPDGTLVLHNCLRCVRARMGLVESCMTLAEGRKRLS